MTTNDRSSTNLRNLWSKLIWTFIASAMLILTAMPTFAYELGSSNWVQTKQNALRLISAKKTTGNSKTLLLGLHFKLKPGWKIYWRSPGDAGYPPKPSWNRSENIESAILHWPAPERFSLLDIETIGYSKEVVLPITVKRIDVSKPVRLGGNVSYLVCDKICIPHDVEIALELNIGDGLPSRFAHLINRFNSTVPKDGKNHRISITRAKTWNDKDFIKLRINASSVLPFKAPDLFPEGPPIITFSKPSITLGPKRQNIVFDMQVFGVEELSDELGNTLVGRWLTLTIVDGKRSAEAKLKIQYTDTSLTPKKQGTQTSLLSILALAILGGLILNLMPCVLPVLSIKLLSILNHSDSDTKLIRYSFLASAAGIIFSFLVLAVTLIAIKAGGTTIGWGIQFQHPWFLITMIIIVMAFACNLWGFYEFRLPVWISNLSINTDKLFDIGNHFLQGILATLLSTPCLAPFLGTAIGFAMARSWMEISTVFTAIGFGLAMPYLIIAAFPILAKKLPKPGPWMITLKRLLGLALTATWLWLLSILSSNIGLIGASLVGGLTALIAGLFLLGRRAIFGITITIIATFLVPRLQSFDLFENLSKKDENYFSYSNLYSPDDFWIDFDEAAIPGLVLKGKTILIDVTADWCLTCQFNKKLVLNKKLISKALAKQKIVAMRADWTLPNPNIASYLAKFNRYGIPLNTVYGPNIPNGMILPEILSENVVLDAFARASKNSRKTDNF